MAYLEALGFESTEHRSSQAFDQAVQDELRFAVDANRPNPLKKASSFLGMTPVQTTIFLAMVGLGGYMVLKKRRR